ncbi:barstar family protein [Paenibacillus periandrae]|uniref:barstar family protein n=1 Tax=Paenibacillus periandrae TaxID=1761741 RepID=UPI001F08EFE8|nr:barstar family protein [Paenibacillus periandrae]
MNKYLLIDDKSDLLIGNCMDIVGFLGKRSSKVCDLYGIVIQGLELSETFIDHCLATKSEMTGIHINMLSQDGKIIGSYNFILDKPYYFLKNPITLQGILNLQLSGEFASELSIEAEEIWNQWMIKKPTKINTWSSLSQRQRLGWLEVIRIHSATYYNNSTNKKNYYLDMTHVVDSKSFYYALGEAMNGPGGYYGSCLDSLDDCFCGGFGAKPPFALHFSNGNFNELIHQYKIKESERVKLQKIEDLLISNQVTLIC